MDKLPEQEPGDDEIEEIEEEFYIFDDRVTDQQIIIDAETWQAFEIDIEDLVHGKSAEQRMRLVLEYDPIGRDIYIMENDFNTLELLGILQYVQAEAAYREIST